MHLEAVARARHPLVTDPSVTASAAASRWREAAGVAGLLVAVFVVFLYRLSSVVISDMDEGTYLYAGKLLTQGLLPYRDFLLAHPPLVVLLAAGWESLAGYDIMAARLAYLAVVLLSTIPLYLIARRLTGAMAGGLFAVATYTSGMLLLANMGRTIRLEPIMNAFLIGGFALYLLRPGTTRVRLLIGALFAAAVLVKLVAVVPIAFLVLGDLFWPHDKRRFLTWWAMVALGGASVLLPASALLLAQPHFVQDVLLSQLARPGLPWSLRATYLIQDLVRFPIIPIALIAAAWLLVRGVDARARVVALVSLGGTLGLVFAFRTFFGYYLVQILPWIAVLFAMATFAVLRRLTPARTSLIAAGLIVLFGAAIPLAYEEVYFRTAKDHVASPAAIVPLLSADADKGYMYAMYPAFALWSNRAEVPGYYAADSLIPRLTGQLGDAEFIQTFSGAQSIVLFEGELTEYPQAQAYLAENFSSPFHDANYSLWVRK